MINSVQLIKSGTDFEEFSVIDIDFTTKKTHRASIKITDKYIPDHSIASIVEQFTIKQNEKLMLVCGHSETDLEGHFELIRT